MSPRSPDLRCARETADMIAVKLVELDVPPPTADDLAGVVSQIEMPFKAQIEIGWPCLKLADAIGGGGVKVTSSGGCTPEFRGGYRAAPPGIGEAHCATE